MNADIFVQLLDYAGQLPTYKTHNKQQSLQDINANITQNEADKQQKADS